MWGLKLLVYAALSYLSTYAQVAEEDARLSMRQEVQMRAGVEVVGGVTHRGGRVAAAHAATREKEEAVGWGSGRRRRMGKGGGRGRGRERKRQRDTRKERAWWGRGA